MLEINENIGNCARSGTLAEATALVHTLLLIQQFNAHDGGIREDLAFGPEGAHVVTTRLQMLCAKLRSDQTTASEVRCCCFVQCFVGPRTGGF